MTISITEKEFDALLFAITQIEGALESATDDSYIVDAEESLRQLHSICRKIKNKRQ